MLPSASVMRVERLVVVWTRLETLPSVSVSRELRLSTSAMSEAILPSSSLSWR